MTARSEATGYVLISDPSGDYVVGSRFHRQDLPVYGPREANLAWERGTRWRKWDGKVLEWDGLNMVEIKSS